MCDVIVDLMDQSRNFDATYLEKEISIVKHCKEE